MNPFSKRPIPLRDEGFTDTAGRGAPGHPIRGGKDEKMIGDRSADRQGGNSRRLRRS